MASMKKIWRTPEAENRFNLLDFYLPCDLSKKYHEAMYFDDFLKNIDKILDKHKDDLHFYTGWNYKPIKEISDGKIKKYGKCEFYDDESIDIPIYFEICKTR